MARKKYSNDNEAELVVFFTFGLILVAFKKINEFYLANPILTIFIIALFIFISLAIVVYLIKNRNQKRLSIEKIEDIHSLHWREFEEFIEFILKTKGFKTKIGPGSKDGGVDIFANFNGRKYLIQCKKWTKYKISEPNIREFFGAINDYDYNAKGIYITTSDLTSDAKNFANRNGIEIWDKFSLEKYVKLYTGKENIEEINNTDDIICEKCGGKMLTRIAKTGNNKGNKFLGCENYPKCKNIINL